jgi:hypothetical protein
MDGIMNNLKKKITNKDIKKKLKDVIAVSKRVIKANEMAADIDIQRNKVLKEITDLMDKEYGEKEWVDLDFLNARVLLKEDFNKQAFRLINTREFLKEDVYLAENEELVIENEKN